MQITISTTNHQVKNFRGEGNTLEKLDWNRIMRDVINKEEFYDKTRTIRNEAGE